VPEDLGHPAAVLLRALEPVEGVGLMRARRDGRVRVADHELCRGPGNLSRAMGISIDLNRQPLTGGRLTSATLRAVRAVSCGLRASASAEAPIDSGAVRWPTAGPCRACAGG
jgi:DNA-3-methyladenine glycosylase